jgi:heat-inducible transcriptional repressor
MEVLTRRQATLLQFIVGEYVATAAPVSSEALRRRARLQLSAATVRNEMATLEEAGYITRPHISAGGIPGDSAYRYCVQLLMEPPILPRDARRDLRLRIGQVPWDPELWAQVAVRGLSDLTKNLAVITMPRAAEARLRHVATVSVGESLVLLVVVLGEAKVHKSLLHLDHYVDPYDVNMVASKLNRHFEGLSRKEILVNEASLNRTETRVRDEIVGALEMEDRALASDYFIEGLRHLLAEPEFDAVRRTRVLVEALEERRLVQAILREAPEVGALRVVIGHENNDAALKPLSVVVTQYGTPGSITGMIAILGPTRMEYQRAMAGVHYLSRLLGGLLEGAQGSVVPS